MLDARIVGDRQTRPRRVGVGVRIVAARQGERLENLSARTGNSWSPAYTALANALDVEAALREGQLIKIARTEPTRPGSLITDH